MKQVILKGVGDKSYDNGLLHPVAIPEKADSII